MAPPPSVALGQAHEVSSAQAEPATKGMSLTPGLFAGCATHDMRKDTLTSTAA